MWVESPHNLYEPLRTLNRFFPFPNDLWDQRSLDRWFLETLIRNNVLKISFSKIYRWIKTKMHKNASSDILGWFIILRVEKKWDLSQQDFLSWDCLLMQTSKKSIKNQKSKKSTLSGNKRESCDNFWMWCLSKTIIT